MLAGPVMRAYLVTSAALLSAACGSRAELWVDDASPSASAAPSGGSAASAHGGVTVGGASSVDRCDWQLAPAATYPTVFPPSSLAAGDLDGDGDLDLAAGSTDAGMLV